MGTWKDHAFTELGVIDTRRRVVREDIGRVNDKLPTPPRRHFLLPYSSSVLSLVGKCLAGS